VVTIFDVEKRYASTAVRKCSALQNRDSPVFPGCLYFQAVAKEWRAWQGGSRHQVAWILAQTTFFARMMR